MTTGLETEAPHTGGQQADSTEPAPILFVGGTGRSGTHVVSKILGNHSSYRKVPSEVRFHTDEGGFPDVLAGRTGPDLFVYRLRHHWYRNFEARRFTFRGFHNYVPKSRLDAASASFLRRFKNDEPEAALRQLFFDLLWPLATEWSKSGLIEQSCDTVREAGTLSVLFPEARFVHVVRDGRDVAASRVGQARWMSYPRTMDQGLEWWEQRIRAIDDGVRAAGADRVAVVSLDDLVTDEGRRRSFAELRRFAGLPTESDMLEYFKGRVKVRNAHTERWRDAVPARRQADIDARYSEILDSLEADGVHCAGLLRRVRERSAS